MNMRWTVALLFAVAGARAQDAPQGTSPVVPRARPHVATNAVTWFTYGGEHPLTRRLRLVLDETVRRADGVRVWQQLEASQGVTYVVRDGIELTSGYAYIATFPYGDLPVPARRPEHRLWEEVELARRTGRVAWESRTRVEHRWIGSPDMALSTIADDRWREATRLRQRLGATIPLLGAGTGDAWYLAPNVEAFLRVAPDAGVGGFLEETRTAVALGSRVGRHTRIEVGYLYQLARRAAGREQERNHALLLALRSDVPFSRR